MNRPRIIRLDLSDPAMLRRLTLNGVIWRHPSLWQDAIDAIQRGDVRLSDCVDVPPEVRAALGR